MARFPGPDADAPTEGADRVVGGSSATADRFDSAAPPEANPQLPRPRPREQRPGPLGFLRDSILMAWRWLTRMRTALYLLAGLGLLTLLATAVPQQPNVPTSVAAWRAGDEGPGVAVSQVIDALGGYDVYGSGLFLALLVLLYLSLTACLIPRIRAWVRLVRRSQPPLLRHVGRHDEVASFSTDRAPDEVLATAREHLAGRWRLRAEDDVDTDAPPQVAAERGLWSREGGSLLFHVSFYVLLIAIILGQLLTFEGQRGVVEGEPGFTDAPISYWTYRPGQWFGEDDHAGWRLAVDEFHIDWVRDPSAPGAGQPTLFRSDVTVTPADGEPYQATIEGNQPLVVDGMKIHQLDWGYALRVVVEVDDEVVHDGFVHSQSDGGVYVTAVKAPSADPDVGLALALIPFAPDGPDGRPIVTPMPWDDAPVLAIDQYRGDLQLGATQQTVNELDTSELELVGQSALRLGGEVELEGVTVSFPELRRWVGFQVSTRPQVPWLLFGSALLVGGLIAALYAYRRRVWVLVTREGDGSRTLVTITGRAFQREDAFENEHAELVDDLLRLTDGVRGPGIDPGGSERTGEDAGGEVTGRAAGHDAPLDELGGRKR